MSEATIRQRTPRVPQPGMPLLACRLRRTEVLGRRGAVSNMGEIELENLSLDPLEIPYHMTALQHLNLVVTQPNGVVVSEGHFGDRFAPTAEPAVLRLLPGERFTATVPLLATTPRAGLALGTYGVQAVYEFGGIRAVSEAVQIDLTGTEQP